MVAGLFHRFGDLIEHLAQADQRVDQKTGKNRKCNRRNQSRNFSSTMAPSFLAVCVYTYTRLAYPITQT